MSKVPPPQMLTNWWYGRPTKLDEANGIFKRHDGNILRGHVTLPQTEIPNLGSGASVWHSRGFVLDRQGFCDFVLSPVMLGSSGFPVHLLWRLKSCAFGWYSHGFVLEYCVSVLLRLMLLGRGHTVGHDSGNTCGGALADEPALSQESLGPVLIVQVEQIVSVAGVDVGTARFPAVREYSYLEQLQKYLCFKKFLIASSSSSYTEVLSKALAVEQNDDERRKSEDLRNLVIHDQRPDKGKAVYSQYESLGLKRQKIGITDMAPTRLRGGQLAFGSSSYREFLSNALAVEQNDVEDRKSKDWRNPVIHDQRTDKGKAVQGQYESLGLKRQKIGITDGVPARLRGGQLAFGVRLCLLQVLVCLLLSFGVGVGLSVITGFMVCSGECPILANFLCVVCDLDSV
ncbi:hypothetical protein GIB67_037844 [Kingdonia uniflora]|uniref:Uncharacterized protein n=1 Tax=Kingdonia uniflora TaxID=39325 RepID=A0A7J7LGU2_9MAGN|nr:hypothetical protein GIB67_037844 [Kingdonia uniflora]